MLPLILSGIAIPALHNCFDTYSDLEGFTTAAKGVSYE